MVNICSKCGKPGRSETDKFCFSCGTKLNSVVNSSQDFPRSRSPSLPPNPLPPPPPKPTAPPTKGLPPRTLSPTLLQTFNETKSSDPISSALSPRGRSQTTTASLADKSSVPLVSANTRVGHSEVRRPSAKGTTFPPPSNTSGMSSPKGSFLGAPPSNPSSAPSSSIPATNSPKSGSFLGAPNSKLPVPPIPPKSQSVTARPPAAEPPPRPHSKELSPRGSWKNSSAPTILPTKGEVCPVCKNPTEQLGEEKVIVSGKEWHRHCWIEHSLQIASTPNSTPAPFLTRKSIIHMNTIRGKINIADAIAAEAAAAMEEEEEVETSSETSSPAISNKSSFDDTTKNQNTPRKDSDAPLKDPEAPLSPRQRFKKDAADLFGKLKKEKKTKDKPKKKKKKKKVKPFGVDLEIVLEAEGRDTFLPIIIEKTVEYLDLEGMETEGIFRISPRHAELLALCKLLDKGIDVDLHQYKDPHLIAGLMKKWFRELPDPLLTFELYTCFIAIWEIKDEAVRTSKLRAILGMLPDCNRGLVQYMLDYLARVSRHAQNNKMNTSNLATIFGPIFLRSDIFFDEIISESSTVCAITKDLIEKRAELFHDAAAVEPSR